MKKVYLKGGYVYKEKEQDDRFLLCPLDNDDSACGDRCVWFEINEAYRSVDGKATFMQAIYCHGVRDNIAELVDAPKEKQGG